MISSPFLSKSSYETAHQSEEYPSNFYHKPGSACQKMDTSVLESAVHSWLAEGGWWRLHPPREAEDYREKNSSPQQLESYTKMTSTASFNISGRLIGNINLGPLSTIFTPPPSCLRHLYLERTVTPPIMATFLDLVPTDTFPTLGWPTQTECYPPGYQAASSAFRASHGDNAVTFGGYFSPAACPEGYTSACTEDILLTSSGEQIALCCPRCVMPHLIALVAPLTIAYSGYRCWPLKGSCISQFTTNDTVTFIFAGRVVAEEHISGSSRISSGSTFTWYTNSATAAPIQVRRAPSDTVGWVVGPTIKEPSQLSTANIESALTIPSIGPAIYLSVGIPLTLIILGLVFFFHRASRARRKAIAELSRLDIGVVEKAELAGECVMPHESGGIMRAELDGIEAVDVVGGHGTTAELETPIAELEAPFPELEGAVSPAASKLAEQLPTEDTVPAPLN